MGNGAICTRVVDESVQMPSISPIKRSSTSSLLQTHHIPVAKPPSISPLEEEEEEAFMVTRNTDQYSSIWDNNAKLSSAFPPNLKAEFDKGEHHQKETMSTKWARKNSANIDTTHVESLLSSQTQSSISLSTSEKIDGLIKDLNRIHSQLDETIKRRTQQISVETESVLAHIINETHEEQQRLLHYAKEQQTRQDEHYRELLQKYIAQLDEMKAQELALLQEELHDSREEIIQVSHMKIMSVNEQANMIKSKIIKEEQKFASIEIDAINSQLQRLSTDKTFQQLDSELITKTNFVSNTNVGTKLSGQKTSFEFVQDVPIEDINKQENSSNVYTKTTYTNLKTSSRLDYNEGSTQIAKKVPINPKAQIKESR